VGFFFFFYYLIMWLLDPNEMEFKVGVFVYVGKKKSHIRKWFWYYVESLPLISGNKKK
jgi:hypothetical protein